MDMVRIRVYDGKGRPMGDLDVPASSAQIWLSARDEASLDLAGIREIVDPEHQNESYDWDIWARPAEIREDLGIGGEGEAPGPEDLLRIS